MDAYQITKKGYKIKDVRDEMCEDISEIYKNNSLFRSCVDRGVQHGFSYERILEMVVRYYVTIQERYDNAELERLVNEPPKPAYLTEEELMILNYTIRF